MRFAWTWQPADYRAKADWYMKKARTAPSFERCERYAELAARCRETAQRLEMRMDESLEPRGTAAAGTNL